MPMAGAEAAEQAANKARKVAARRAIPQQDKSKGGDSIAVPGIPLSIGEYQGSTTMNLALRTLESLYRSL